MISLIKELYCALNAKQLRQIYLMQFVMIISAFSEIATVTAIGIFIFSVGNPEAIKDSDYFVYLIDFLPYYTRNDAVFVVVLLVVLVILISTLLSILTLWLVTKFGYSFGVSIENQLFGYFLNKDWLFHTKNSSSSLINKITNECTRVAGGIVIPLLTMNSKIVMIVAMIVTMVLYDPIVAISMTLFFIAIYTLIYFFIRKRLKLNGVIIAESDTNRFKVMSSGFGGIKDILVLRRQNKFSKKFDKHGKAKADSYIVNGVLGSVPKNVIEFAAFLDIIVIVLYSSNKQQIDLNVLFPILAMYGIAGLKLLPAFQSVYQSAAQIKGHIAAFNSIKHHISAAKNARNIKADNHTKSNISGDIILKNISYSYPDSAFKSLSNIDMKIVENTTVGIVGHSGSGKSTLIDILLGLMPGTEGDFYVGDDLINKKKLPLWQKKIGFVPQSIYLMDASIKENIAFGLP